MNSCTKTALLLLVFFWTLSSHAQSFPIDTAYSTSFAFTEANGDPRGTYVYNVDNVESGFAVFQYSDGRKFVGNIAYGHPNEATINRIYYPDGTIYIGKTPLSNTFAPAVIYYPDGSLFVGHAGNYRERLGFLFAPDGSYMMGRFWWKKSYNFVTSYFDKNHVHLADEYSTAYNTAEIDLEEYLKIQKKQKPVPERDGNEKVVWDNSHKKYKYENKNVESEHIGWQTQNWHIGIGGFAWSKYKSGDTTRISNSISHEVSSGWFSSYTTPGYNASTLNYGSGWKIGAERVEWDTATIEFNTLRPSSTSSEPYLEYHIRKDGNSYLGAASDNRANGYGIIYYAANGATYFGEIAVGKRQGYGTYKLKDGSYIKGNWKGDERFGISQYYNAQGKLIEEGEYVGGGKVRLQKNTDLGYYALVDEYPIAKNEPAIQTTYVTKKPLTDGAVYSGNVSNGLPEGEGELTMANGDVYSGKWHLGVPVGVCNVVYKPVLVAGKISQGVYKGTLKNFRWEGLGHLTIDSTQFIGNFKEGQLNGTGSEIWPDGFVETGGWYKGQRNGLITLRDINGNDFGYSTYTAGIKNGHSQNVSPSDGREMDGEMANGKAEGQWTVYALNMHMDGGKMVPSPSRLSYLTYKNGALVNSQNNAETPPDFRYHNPDDDIPVCTYCRGTGVVYTGEKFMGKDIPKRCPQCRGKGRTWLNSK